MWPWKIPLFFVNNFSLFDIPTGFNRSIWDLVGPDHVASEDASIATLVEPSLSECSQANLFYKAPLSRGCSRHTTRVGMGLHRLAGLYAINNRHTRTCVPIAADGLTFNSPPFASLGRPSCLAMQSIWEPLLEVVPTVAMAVVSSSDTAPRASKSKDPRQVLVAYEIDMMACEPVEL